ncbi:hypothetical protein C2G38_2152240 [Gigaspora rosea]|uniref:Uncharacterized protein n=1 Tax=Gigaspora rosea TaxID=44941 RepID=A0A397W8Y9_9GLOM|nr:hypothetical protein C2G38_2152240 [Gigaspora rosea]
MPIHTSVVVFITTKNENNSFIYGDIVSIAGKFVIENSEQFITIALATVVDKKDSTDEFNSEIIPFHLIFNATVARDLKTSSETIHFGVETREYNSCTQCWALDQTDEISTTISSIHNDRTKQDDDNNEQKQNIKPERDLKKEKIKEIKKKTEKENHINIKMMIAMTLNKHLT